MRPRTRARFAALACVWLALVPASAGAAELMLKGGLPDAGNPDLGFAAPTGITASLDGRSVYVVGFAEDAINVFQRNEASGVLSFMGALRNGANGIDGLSGLLTAVVSGDGANLYALARVDGSVGIFRRDRVTGSLLFLGRIQNGIAGTTGLSDPRSVVESVDGLFLYVACEAAVVVFARNPVDGGLSFVEAVPLPANSGAQGIAVSPDGKHVYVGGYALAELRIYARDEVTGALTPLDVVTNGQDGVEGLAGVDSVVVSPDGASVYANGTLDSSIVHFARDAGTGLLQFVERETEGVGGVIGLTNSAGLSIGGPRGTRVYAGGADGAVAVFTRSLPSGALAFLTWSSLPAATFLGSGQQILAVGDHLYVLNAVDSTIYLFSTAVLNYVTTLQDGVGGVNAIAGADGLAISRNGAQLYVAAQDDDSVTTFQVDRRTGALSAPSVVTDGVGGVDGLATPIAVTISRDARNLYAAGFNDAAIATFTRNPVDGTLAFVEFERDGKQGVTEMLGPRSPVVSPDGKFVYVSAVVSDSVVWFARNAANGALSFGGFVKNGVGGVSGLDSAYGVAISPDGKHVYAAGLADDSIVIFTRNATTGALTFVARVQDGVAGVDGLNAVSNLAVSPDGRHVYAAGTSDNAIAVFTRNATTGALGFVERIKDNEGDVLRLNNPFGIAMSHDGHWLMAVSSTENALDVFHRDLATGRLFLAQVEENGLYGVAGLFDPLSLATARTGFATYVTGHTAATGGTGGFVVVFSPEPDSVWLGAAATAAIAALARRRARG